MYLEQDTLSAAKYQFHMGCDGNCPDLTEYCLLGCKTSTQTKQTSACIKKLKHVSQVGNQNDLELNFKVFFLC